MQLTEHFELEEFVRSSVADTKGIDNTPTAEVVENLRALCRHVLEPARRAFGAPIIISSGYRSPALNKAVGGVKNSQHMTGEAADLIIEVEDKTAKERERALRDLFDLIDEHGVYDQLLWERKGKTHWVHVSYTQYHNRRQKIDNYKV